MHVLLLSMSAHLTEQLGMAPGGEFRRAFREVRDMASFQEGGWVIWKNYQRDYIDSHID